MVIDFIVPVADYNIIQLCIETGKLSPVIAKQWVSLLRIKGVISLLNYEHLFALIDGGDHE